MLYQLFEMQHAAMAPWRMAARAQSEFWLNEGNPLARTHVGRQAKASLQLFERLTRRYAKPTFDILETKTSEGVVEVVESVVWQKPFCKLLHFAKKDFATKQRKLLIVAPMSGHFATLLRTPWKACCRNMMSTSPTGPTPATWPPTPAASTLMITPTT